MNSKSKQPEPKLDREYTSPPSEVQSQMTENLQAKICANKYIIRASTLIVDGKIVNKTFNIDVVESGEYFLNAWVMATAINEGTNKTLVYLDDQEEPIGELKVFGTGWQATTMIGSGRTALDKQLSLSAGTHMITFSCKTPEVPTIEFVQLSKRNAQVALGGVRYHDYIESLKERALPENYAQVKSEPELDAVLDNPEGNYNHEVDIGFNYTFYRWFYLTAGTTVVFETRKSDPYGSDPYMYLFHAQDPVYKGTWADDDGGAGWQSKITAKIQHTGYYLLLIRAYNSNNPGTSDLWKDGSLYASNIAVAGTKLYCGGIITSDPLNFFTCKLSGDSRIWLQSYYTGNGIVCHNDDYSGSGDFSWSLASRVKDRVYRIRYAIASTYSSYNPTGNCDVYMACQNSTITSYFPNLKADDAIQSAPASSNYNCISWSGGRVDLGRYFWPPNAGNPWRGSTALESFDNFYGNTKNGQPLCRDYRAMDYTRSGAHAGNAAVALWALGSSYTHASVTKPGNDHPHGYDWESKPGGLMRTFHPRDALEDSSSGGYGKIVAYYRWDGTRCYGNPPMKASAIEESNVMSKVEKVEFTRADNDKLHELSFTISHEVRDEFDRYYREWKNTWSDPALQIHSNPRVFAQSEAYDRFLSYCREQGKQIWPLIFGKFAEGDVLTINPIEDLTFDEYSQLMDEIHERSSQAQVDIIPSQTANWTRYVLKVLSELNKEYKNSEQ